MLSDLAVWRPDRLVQSLKHLIDPMAELAAGRIGFQSVTESIDTTTPSGKLVFHIFGRPRNLSVTSSSNRRARPGSRESTRQERRQAKKAWREAACRGGRFVPSEEAHKWRDLQSGRGSRGRRFTSTFASKETGRLVYQDRSM